MSLDSKSFIKQFKSIRMKPIIKISRHLNSITQENLFTNKRIVDFNTSNTGLWKGTKRYAH